MSDNGPTSGSMSSLERVASAAETLGLDIEIRTLDQSTRTAEDAARACGCDIGQIVKSLVFENGADSSLMLVLASGRHNVDLDHIRDTHGIVLRRCDARRVRDETGFAIGGVAPIGHLRSIATLMDQTLLDHPIVWAAAGRPDSVFSAKPESLRAAISPNVVSVRAG